MNTRDFESHAKKRFQQGGLLLPPLKIEHCLWQSSPRPLGSATRPDVEMIVSLGDTSKRFHFFVECRADNTRLSVELAWSHARDMASKNETPLIIVPYLSAERLDYLAAQDASGVDLCGNGIVVVPNRIYIRISGEPNLYPTSRPLQNPFKGRSALAARMLLSRARWESVGELRVAIEAAGARLSASQVSKVVKALQEDLILTRQGSQLMVNDRLRLLDKLGKAWESPRFGRSRLLRLLSSNAFDALVSDVDFNWAIMGESSVERYATFSQGGPRRIAVSDLATAWHQLESATEPEPVRNFADLELCETDEPGFYFDNDIDRNGVRWASRLQTWLELQNGDARQQEAARDLHQQITGTLALMVNDNGNQMWQEFAPLWRDLSAMSAPLLICGGYGLFLKQQWLLSPQQRSIPTVIGLERWRDAAPRVTKDVDLILSIDVIASAAHSKEFVAILNVHNYVVIEKRECWQFGKDLPGQKKIIVDVHCCPPSQKIDTVHADRFRVKHKPSLQHTGVHGRTNPQATGSHLHPFAFDTDATRGVGAQSIDMVSHETRGNERPAKKGERCGRNAGRSRICALAISKARSGCLSHCCAYDARRAR